MKKAFDTPWKITNRFYSSITLPYVRFLFALNNIPWGRDWRFLGIPIIQKHRLSSIKFGPGLNLRSTVRSNPLGPNHPVILSTLRAEACLEIGESFAMTGGTLCAAEMITIGNRVALGANAIIVDTDFHPLDPARRLMRPNDGETAPVIIEDEVFIGMNSLILKGVTIGQGSVIGAGSVVTHDVPKHVIVAGNPARIIRSL